jgi:hypothetical protein
MSCLKFGQIICGRSFIHRDKNYKAIYFNIKFIEVVYEYIENYLFLVQIILPSGLACK